MADCEYIAVAEVDVEKTAVDVENAAVVKDSPDSVDGVVGVLLYLQQRPRGHDYL